MFVGTNVLIRRKALLDVGGFAYGSVTEDIHTGMRIHNQVLVRRHSVHRVAR